MNKNFKKKMKIRKLDKFSMQKIYFRKIIKNNKYKKRKKVDKN